MDRLLLIGMNFHTYEDNIIRCLEGMGFKVDKITDKPKRPHGYGIISEQGQKKDQTQFQAKLLKSIDRSYDVVLVFVGRNLQRFFVEELRKRNPNAKFILYLWDDLARVANFNDVKEYYDEIITFELEDSLKHGFRFVPLYYMPEYHITNNKKLFDVCTVSSEHSDRMEIIRKLFDNSAQDIKYNFRILAGWLPFIKYSFSGKKIEDEKNGLFYTSKSASITETAQLMSVSRAILDIQHFTQKGLTNRTLEALGAGIKLVTTNEEVKYYDFYNPHNICIIDRENPFIDINFLHSPYEEVPMKIYDKYSLKSWLKDILFKTNEYYLNCNWEEAKKQILGE